MKEQIEKLEAQLKELKAVYENEQKIKYESQSHKHFEEGDIVTNGKDTVVVEWTENNAIGVSYEKGSYKTKKMEEKTNLDKIPSDIKYYLLGWKDRNMDDYIRKYGDLRLRDLSLDQLHALFSYATTKDGALLARVAS